MNLLRLYREAFGLGVIAEVWPDGEPWDVNLAHQVERTLARGRAPRGRGGNPLLVKPETRRAERARAGKILVLAEELREPWKGRMIGVDLHALRKTHRTWALSQGVAEVLIDKQLGHAPRASSDSIEVMRIAASSETGRRHYLDMQSALLEAGRSAVAVRALIEEGLASVKALAPRGGADPYTRPAMG